MTASQTAEPTTTATRAPAVSVRGLSHTYRPVKQRRSRKHAAPPQDAALDNVDLDIHASEIFALLGPNGSGKSTLLRILATVQSPRDNTGSVSVFGSDLLRNARHVRQTLGVVFQHPALDLKLSAFENLSVHARLYGIDRSQVDQAVNHALDRLGLADRMHDRVESFSGGMRRRVEIAKALLSDPRLLLMDEASAGLDLAIQREIWADLRERVAEAGLTVLLTTHLMEEAEQADRVAIMAKGRVIAVDTPEALVASVGGELLEITPISGTTPSEVAAIAEPIVRKRFGDASPTLLATAVRFEHPSAAAVLPELTEALGERICGIRLGKPTLADAYLKLTGQSLDA
jgi:ABC-2 type transport system ATP-binding protein